MGKPVKIANPSDVYLHVTTDVLNNVVCNFRDELRKERITDEILDQIQELWELKMLKCGVVQHTTAGTCDVDSVGDPMEQSDSELLGQDEIDAMYRLYGPMAICDVPSPVACKGKVLESGADADMQTGLLALDKQQPSPLTSKKPFSLDLNVAYEEERKECGVVAIPKTESPAKDNLPKDYIPRQDGYAYTNFYAPLNENDDDEYYAEDGDEEPSNLVLAQFIKVGKRKNIWKCTFKDGIMHLNNREILFSTATGQFDF